MMKALIFHYIFTLTCILYFISGSIAQPCNGGPCGENAVYCFDETLEQWECKCIRGFQSISITPVNCTDINECSEVAMHNCGNHTRCRNAIGYYTCECIAGFEKLQAKGGRWECSDFNECGAWPRNNCGNGTECVNTFGGYTCRCEAGYTSPKISFGQTVCSDLDECSSNSHNCGEGTWCQNREGSYRCNCAPGYRRVGLVSSMNICTDVDECAVDVERRCGNFSRCINTPGSFTCLCVSGFISPTADGQNCADPRGAAVQVPSVVNTQTERSPSADLYGNEEKKESGGELYVGVGVGIGAAFVIIAIFFMVAYIAGSERKKGKQSIQHDVHKYQVDPKHKFIDTDSPVYEDIGPPLTSMTAATLDRSHMFNVPVPVSSSTLGRRQPVRTVSECVDNQSVQNWRLVHNEINQALYAAGDFDDTPIYCNTMERNKRARPRLEPMVEELYYSPVYHSCDNIHSMSATPPRPKPPVAPKHPSLVDRVHTHTPKRHVIRRNRQRLWVSRVHSDADISLRQQQAPELPPGHPAFRRLASEGDLIDAKKKQSNHDLMEGTILRCGDKYYILEPQETDEVTGKPTLFGISKQHADEGR